MQTDIELMNRYFSRKTALYKRVYEKRAGRFASYWWRPLLRYQEATLEALGDLKGKHILEIGCGTGHLAVAIAKRGASVLALDICPKMIDVAKEHAIRSGVADRILFQVSNFENFNLSEDQQYDWIIAISVFDYCSEPYRWLEMMFCLGDKIIATFPMRNLLQKIVRYINSLIRGGFPVMFYQETQIPMLFTKTGWNVHTIRKLRSSCWVHATHTEVP